MKKSYFGFIIIFLVIIVFTYLYIYKIVFVNSNYFIKNSVKAKIIKVYNYENKSLQFYYTDKYCITTTDTKKDTLQIGDSISKEKNSENFRIFRKDSSGKYKFYKEY